MKSLKKKSGKKDQKDQNTNHKFTWAVHTVHSCINAFINHIEFIYLNKDAALNYV